MKQNWYWYQYSTPQNDAANALFGSCSYGPGTGTIVLDDVNCYGDEVNIFDCPRFSSTPLGISNCDHSEDAGVVCNGETNEYFYENNNNRFPLS